jgi:hypothetical protein
MADDRLPQVLTEQRLDAFVEALSITYAECQARFDRSIGFDSQTFGQMVYKSSWFHLDQVAAADDGIAVIRDANGFELDLEGVRLHPFKVGHRANDIYDRLPSNELVFELMANQNLYQLSLLPEIQPQMLVLAHVGNPDDGLCAVYVAAPIIRAGGVKDWAFVVRIDHFGDAADAAVPQPVDINPPELKILPDKAGDEESSGFHDA